MTQVTAYRCPFTGKLFALHEKEAYAAHLRKVRKHHDSVRNNRRIRRNWKAFNEEGKQKVHTLRELGRWLIDSSAQIGTHGRIVHSVAPGENFKITEVKFRNPRYSSTCSNSHSAPVGKKTNWGGRKDGVPRSYPGVSCNMEIRIEGMEGGYLGDIFSSVRVHLGTGGWRGDGCYHYSSTIWLEDWPGLEETLSVAVLKGAVNDLFHPGEITVTETP